MFKKPKVWSKWRQLLLIYFCNCCCCCSSWSEPKADSKVPLKSSSWVTPQQTVEAHPGILVCEFLALGHILESKGNGDLPPIQ